MGVRWTFHSCPCVDDNITFGHGWTRKQGVDSFLCPDDRTGTFMIHDSLFMCGLGKAEGDRGEVLGV
jgi:hypothetical protein